MCACLEGREIAHSARGVHLCDQTVADPWQEAGPPGILPVLEPRSSRYFESFEERSADIGVACVEALHVDVDRCCGERDPESLDKDVLAPNLLPHRRERLRERMPSPQVGHAGPQKLRQVFAGKAAVTFQRETNQKGKLFTGIETNLLASLGAQERGAQTQEM